MGSALAAIVIAQTVVGNVLYPHYLRNAKPTLQALAAGARSAADVFEVKEHLAFVALVLALGAFAATRRDPRPTVFVRSLFGAAHGAILLVAVLGLVVASLKTP
jgi:ABC-type sulfate transport system permease component